MIPVHNESAVIEVTNSESVVDEETIESAEAVNPVVVEDDTIQETLENENMSGVDELPIQDVATEPIEQVVTEQSESEVID